MAERSPTLRHRAEDAVLRSVLFAADRLSQPQAERLGAALGRTVHALGMRRDVALDNLRRAFPERDEVWVRDVAKRSYEHFGREMVATLRLQSTIRASLIERSTVTGLDEVSEALRQGSGAILVTGHLGNWEVGTACLTARGLEIDGVMQRQSNPLADARINANRERLGIQPIDRRQAAKLGLRALREGRALGFVADQDARSGGVFVPFFGRPASTHRGPALLALRSGAPLFAATCIRAPDGRYDCRIVRIDESREGEPDEVVFRLTAAFTRILEAAIRTAPQQYLWQHRRWKSSSG